MSLCVVSVEVNEAISGRFQRDEVAAQSPVSSSRQQLSIDRLSKIEAKAADNWKQRATDNMKLFTSG
jgi:hypothetical protein